MAYKNGAPIPDCLLEAASWHYTVKIACRCGHVALYDPHALWWLYERKGWDGNFREMQRRYFCSLCHRRTRHRFRPAITAETYDKPTVVLPLPPDEEWKRARQRFR